MNAREKILALIVGLMLACGGIYFVYDSLSAGLDKRSQQITQLRQQLDEKRRKLRLAKRAVDRLRRYEEISLPSDGDFARSLYQTWLLERIDESGLHDVNVTVSPTKGRPGVYQRHTFEITAKGDLAQLTALLYDFHWVDRLHRIQRLTVSPIKETKDLDIGVTIEALSLPGSELKEALNDEPAEQMVLADADAYRDVIVGRNLFAQANNPPKLASISSQSAYVDRSVNLTLKAQDPDKLDSVTYRISGDAPPGATLNSKTGEFTWTPKTKGEFTATFVAVDNGLPARSDQQVVKFTVTDPPPPPPPAPPTKRRLDFDAAKFTFLSGVTEAGDRTEAWFTIRTTGELLKLRVGQKIAVGSIEGKIARIDADSVEITTPEKPVTVLLGENLLGTRE